MFNSVSNYDDGLLSKMAYKNGHSNFVALNQGTTSREKNNTSLNKPEQQADADKFGLRLVKIGLLTALIVFVIARGAPKKVRSKFDQANKNLIDLEVGEGKRTGPLSRIRRSLSRLAAYSRAIFNLAPLKDVVISKALKKSKFTDKIGQGLTDIFEKISVKTLVRSHEETHKKFESLFADFAKANKKLPKNEANNINHRIVKIRRAYADGFSDTARRQRLNAVKNEFDGYDETGKHKIGDSLMEKVWKDTYKNFKKFIEESAYTTFVSEKNAASVKLKNEMKVNKHKFLISNSLNSLCEDSFNLLIHLDTFIEHKDEDPRKIIKKIATPLNQYKKVVRNGGDGSKILLNGNIAKNLKQLDAVFKNTKKYDEKTIEEASEAIKSLTGRLENYKRGEINEIMLVYKRCLPLDEYEKLRKSAYATTNSLERSVDFESNKLFEKIRDLKIGSAPKDFLVVLSSFVGVGYGLSKADNKEKKISASIKYGVPTIGAVAIMVYCTVGLISAGPSLLIGLLSGLAMNQVGTVVDNFRKKMKNKNSQKV